MAKPKVLISDELSPRAVEIFAERGCDVDFKPGLKPAELRAIIGNYEGLAIRSATRSGSTRSGSSGATCICVPSRRLGASTSSSRRT
mgnify:CR=1 FL=1